MRFPDHHCQISRCFHCLFATDFVDLEFEILGEELTHEDGAFEEICSQQSAESEVDQFTGIKLEIGSDLEIARLCINDMFANDGRYVFSEGAFYHWTGRIWAELSDVDVQKRFVSRYDGARDGGSGVIRLDQHKAKSIIKFIALEMEIGDYFQDRPLGVNCQNGFVIFDKDGNVSLIEHHPASPRALSRAACALAVS